MKLETLFIFIFLPPLPDTKINTEVKLIIENRYDGFSFEKKGRFKIKFI